MLSPGLNTRRGCRRNRAAGPTRHCFDVSRALPIASHVPTCVLGSRSPRRARIRPPRSLRAARLCAGLVAVLLSLGPQWSATAQQNPAAKAAAEALFDQGLQLMREGQYPEACKQLESSQSLDPAIGTMLYLAECYEKQGRIASAWALFREASSAARQAGQQERAEIGKSRADALEPQLSMLLIEVPEAHVVPSMTVSRNGIALPKASWGVAIPLDPGTHEIKVEAPGYEPWAQSLVIDRGTAQTSVSVPALLATPTAQEEAPAAEAQLELQATATPPAASGPAKAEDRPHEAKEASAADGDTQRVLGLVVGAAGLITIGVGGYFGYRALEKGNDVADQCEGADPCFVPNQATRNAVEQAEDRGATFADASTWLCGAGLAAVAGGALLYLLAPEESEHVAVRLGPSTASLHVRGAF